MKNPQALDHNLRKYLRLVVFASSLSMLLTVALGSGSDAGKMAGRNEDPIKVGVYLDLTGQTSGFGQSTLNGIKMAAEEINAAGGISGRQLKLVIGDEQGEPDKIVAVVKKLIEEDKVHALLGEVASTYSLMAAPHAQAARVPMIAPSSTNPQLTQAGDYIFRTCFIDPFQGEALAKFAALTLKTKRAAIMFDPDSTYSQWLVTPFEREFIKLGGRIVRKQSYSQIDRDFSTQLTSIRAAKPDVIYIPGYYSSAAIIAHQARQMKMNQPLLGGDGWNAPQLWTLGGKAMNNSYMSQHFASDDTSPTVRKFVANYKTKYQYEPNSIAALGYDAMAVLADAIRRAGTTDGPKLRDAIAQTKNFPGVTGSITINHERNAVKPAVISQLLNGKFIYREKVYPDSEARR